MQCRRSLVLFVALFVLGACSGRPDPEYPEGLEGQCAVTEGVVFVRAMLTTTYDAPDGSSATRRSFWDLLCSVPMEICEGTVTVLGESGGIAAGDKTNVEDAQLRIIADTRAEIDWNDALLVVDTADETVYYSGFPMALLPGEGQGDCKDTPGRPIEEEV